MKAEKVFENSLKLIGYGDEYGLEEAHALKPKMLPIINIVYSEIFYIENSDGFKTLTSPYDEIKLSEKAVNDCMIYGVAMYLASVMGDTDSYTLFSQIYEHKQRLLKKSCEIYEKQDVLPKGCDF